MISTNGWQLHNIWEHSTTVRELYTRRCLRKEEEMTCAAQAAELLASRVKPGESLLDVGCGSGYFFHSLANRNIELEYYGVDASQSLISIGQEIMPRFGLSKHRLQVARIEDLSGEVDHVLCMNVLSNIDNFHRPLERLLKMARRSVILRESAGERGSYDYVRDKYLDAGVDLCVHVNTYDQAEMESFIRERGFQVRRIVDRRTNGEPELVIDYPHHWQFFDAERLPSKVESRIAATTT